MKALAAVYDAVEVLRRETELVRGVSVDPIDKFAGEDIRRRFGEHHRNPDALLESRRQTLGRSPADYDAVLTAERYIVAELAALPFEDGAFDGAVLALAVPVFGVSVGGVSRACGAGVGLRRIGGANLSTARSRSAEVAASGCGL